MIIYNLVIFQKIKAPLARKIQNAVHGDGSNKTLTPELIDLIIKGN